MKVPRLSCRRGTQGASLIPYFNHDTTRPAPRPGLCPMSGAGKKTMSDADRFTTIFGPEQFVRGLKITLLPTNAGGISAKEYLLNLEKSAENIPQC